MISILIFLKLRSHAEDIIVNLEIQKWLQNTSLYFSLLHTHNRLCGECRAKSACTYVQSDHALHSPLLHHQHLSRKPHQVSLVCVFFFFSKSGARLPQRTLGLARLTANTDIDVVRTLSDVVVSQLVAEPPVYRLSLVSMDILLFRTIVAQSVACRTRTGSSFGSAIFFPRIDDINIHSFALRIISIHLCSWLRI